MPLSQKDHELFFELYNQLLNYISTAHNIIPVITNPDDEQRSTLEALVTVRDYLYEHPTCFDEFLQDASDLSSDHAEIIRGWKAHHVRDMFYLTKHTAHYSEFATKSAPHMVYAVHSLTTSLKEHFPVTPFMVDAVLLPFCGVIITDGLFKSNNVYFGNNMARGIKMECERDKVRNGLIKTLPHKQTSAPPEDAEALLAFYCKSWANFEEFRDERGELLEDHKELWDTYVQHIGKLSSRALKKELREVLCTKTYVAVYKETVVATGNSREDLEQTIQNIVAPIHRNKLHMFEVRPS